MRWSCKSSLFAGMVMLLVCFCLVGCASLGASQTPASFTHLHDAQFDYDGYQAPLVEIQINPAEGTVDLRESSDPFLEPEAEQSAEPVFENARPVINDSLVHFAVYRPEQAVLLNQRSVVKVTPVSYRVYTRASCRTGSCRTKAVTRTRHVRVRARSGSSCGCSNCSCR